MDASNCKLSSSHPCGVYPLGNSLIDPQARSKRAARLGSFSRFDDELILSLVCAVPPVANCRLACTSSVFRAFCGQEELWREFCLQLLASTGRIEWSAYGSWKSTFVKSSAFHGASKATLHTVQVYSDVLYRSFFCAAAELNSRWLERETIQRVSAQDLTSSDFVRRFEGQSCPVILEGCAQEWPAMQKWSKETLLERFGDVPFECGPCELPLKVFYAYAEANIDDVPLFVFDRSFATRAPSMLEDFEVPAVFRGRDLFDLLGTARPDHRWLLVGSRRSGSKWHYDPNKTCAWNAVVRGRKRWLLLPPGCPPPGVHPSRDGAEVSQPVSLIEWFFNFYSDLRRLVDTSPAWDLKECTCGPGDAVFVPCGWWHCVLNLDDDTIAVTQNYASETHVHSIRRFLREKKDQVSGTKARESLADLFDAALARERPDLLSQTEDDSVHKAACEAHTGSGGDAQVAAPNAFSFWDHLRSTGKSLTFGDRKSVV